MRMDRLLLRYMGRRDCSCRRTTMTLILIVLAGLALIAAIYPVVYLLMVIAAVSTALGTEITRHGGPDA